MQLSKSANQLVPVTNTAKWNDGVLSNTTDTVFCPIAGYSTQWITGEYDGYYGDQAAGTPKIGDIYYVHIVVQDVASCTSTYVQLEMVLPASTYLAVSQQNPIYCFGNGTLLTDGSCPQSPSTGPHGGYYLNPTVSPYSWPLAAGGGSIEVQVPVYSTAAISDWLRTYLTQADGYTNPPDTPQAPVYVGANPPTINYPVPSGTNITNTSFRTTGNLFNHYVGGNVYFDIGSTTAYGTTSAPIAVPSTWNSGSFYNDWTSATPGTTYHWRLRFVTSGAVTYTGADQSVTTTGSAPATARSDFNADGKPDIVLRNYSSGQDAVWLMNGTSLSSIVDLPALTNTAYHFAGVGDFNGDGKPDIILRNYSTGQDAVWLMNGTSLISIVDLPALANTSYHIESCGDFNGDGQTDIVLRNYSTGQDALWLMNGTTLMSTVDLPALTNTAYHFAGVADFNGDGKPDIVLRNMTTGQDALWVMNGTSVSTIVDLPALTNTSYEFDGPR